MMNILIVDDEPAVLKLLSRLLKDQFVVFTAKSVDEAKERYSPLIFALVISDDDCTAPNAGRDWLKKIVKEHGQRVLLMSGKSVEDLGGLPFLPKPFTAAALRAKIEGILERE
jgi:DNA-binding response OmpR family regulator